MQTIEVQVQRDYLERLATAKSPVSAVAELIWNALDADASFVDVDLRRNVLDGLDAIKITDNGHGLSADEAVAVFEKLGGSLKPSRVRSPSGRILHGHQGKGRFQAFALGGDVEWRFRYKRGATTMEYWIRGSRATPKRFTIEEPAVSSRDETGTVVSITGIDRKLPGLESGRGRQVLTEEFALYLREYSAVEIVYDGIALDPSSIEDHVSDYAIEVTTDNGDEAAGTVTVIEWVIPTERALYLCDEHGFTLHQLPPGIHAPGFTFTAYLKAAFIRQLSETGDLQLEELHPDLKKLIERAKSELRAHFRKRAAEKAGGLVERWKAEEVYPYEGLPRSVVEAAERQVFDVVALNVQEYLPDFDSTSVENRRLSFRLLKTAIETSPDAVQLILRDVLNLPREKQEEFAELLEKTSLDAIINASKVVGDRLDFLQALEVLVFSPDGRRYTLERRHLHKIVAEHTWLFGEEFNLTVSDRSLTSVLRRHIEASGVELLDDNPVVREDGSEGIIDLMLSRSVPQSRSEQREHLIVELKRPSVPIGSAEATQVKDYATAVAKDERFRDTNTRWDFWAVSSEITDSVRLEASQAGRPSGLLLDSAEYRLRIWVKTWGQIIEDCRTRLHFFQHHLEYVADEAGGLAYLRRMHMKYLPAILAEDSGQKSDRGGQGTSPSPDGA